MAAEAAAAHSAHHPPVSHFVVMSYRVALLGAGLSAAVALGIVRTLPIHHARHQPIELGSFPPTLCLHLPPLRASLSSQRVHMGRAQAGNAGEVKPSRVWRPSPTGGDGCPAGRGGGG